MPRQPERPALEPPASAFQPVCCCAARSPGAAPPSEDADAAFWQLGPFEKYAENPIPHAPQRQLGSARRLQSDRLADGGTLWMLYRAEGTTGIGVAHAGITSDDTP